MVENLNKVVYQIGYQYWQIFLIHYQLLEYRLNSISVHHYYTHYTTHTYHVYTHTNINTHVYLVHNCNVNFRAYIPHMCTHTLHAHIHNT